MDLTIRAEIIQELFDLFEAFSFDAFGGTQPTIYRGVQRFDPDNDPPPLITILPKVEEAQRTDYGMDEMVMPVDIICLARLDTENPSDLGEDIKGELIACVFGKETTVAGSPVKSGGLTTDYADDVRYRSGGIDQYPSDLDQPILHVGITITVRYQTNAGDPYSNE
jgi:hypothetical protein